MARLSRWSEELPLIRPPHLLFLILLIAGPGPLRAQEQETGSRLRMVRGSVELSPRLTRLNGQTGLLLGAAAMIEISDRWRAGGAGFWIMDEVTVEGGDVGDSSLRFGYGGVVLGWSPTRPGATSERAPEWGARLLVGAGNAEVRHSVLSNRLTSDNFILVEPAVSLERALLTRVTVGAIAALRIALAVDDLNGLGAKDLSGPAVGVELRIGPF